MSADQLTWTLARRCRRGDVVVVGVATPLAACAALLARALLVEDLTVIMAASVDPEAHDVAASMLDASAVSRLSAGTLRQAEILDQIQRGRVTLQFLSPAQVDGAGRLNTSRVPGRRLPGGLATADVAVLVGRLVAYRAAHTPRFLAPRVAFVTGAGHDRGAAWRRERGLPGRGLEAVVTDMAVIEWPKGEGGAAPGSAARPADSAPRLVAVQPGADAGAAVAGCGFPLERADEVPVAEAPPPEAIELLDRVIDPHGIRRLETRDGRDDALRALERLRA